MYFGDHPYADLQDVTLHHGWHTGAVIRELEAEINKMNTDEFKWGVNWQQVSLINQLIVKRHGGANGHVMANVDGGVNGHVMTNDLSQD